MRTFISTLLMLFCALTLSAQTAYELIDEDIGRVAGHYHHYEAPAPDTLAYPEGCQPFYISHYGRHGCRWHTSSLVYRRPIAPLEKAEKDNILTARGKALLETLRFIAADAEGRGGELTPRGVREHRGIAERMYRNYPEVFESREGISPKIESRSTDVPRCILSMCAFNERLKELDPSLQMSRTAYKRDLGYMINRQGAKKISSQAKAECERVQRLWLQPERFLSTLLKDKDYPISEPEKLMYHVFQIASIMQDTDYLELSLFEYFTPEELDALWRCENAYVYLTLGPSLEFGASTIPDAIPLLKQMIADADAVLRGESPVCASLRFGHDQALVPLYALMGIEGTSDRVCAEDADKVWNVSTVTPMGTNLQWIFFRANDIVPDGSVLPHEKADDSVPDECALHHGKADETVRAGSVKVRVLHNEKDAQLPISGAPYYDWNELRSYLLERCEEFK